MCVIVYWLIRDELRPLKMSGFMRTGWPGGINLCQVFATASNAMAEQKKATISSDPSRPNFLAAEDDLRDPGKIALIVIT